MCYCVKWLFFSDLATHDVPCLSPKVSWDWLLLPSDPQQRRSIDKTRIAGCIIINFSILILILEYPYPEHLTSPTHFSWKKKIKRIVYRSLYNNVPQTRRNLQGASFNLCTNFNTEETIGDLGYFFHFFSSNYKSSLSLSLVFSGQIHATQKVMLVLSWGIFFYQIINQIFLWFCGIKFSLCGKDVAIHPAGFGNVVEILYIYILHNAV